MRPRLVDSYTYSDILTAYLECRRRKRGTYPAFCYEIRFEDNLHTLLEEINSGTYEIGPSRVFVVSWPKPREVWAALFRDRIVHHLVCRDVGPYYQAQCVPTNCACIPGRGTLCAAQYLEKYCRSITEGWSKPAWVLQFDIQNFFMSIEHRRLWDVMKPVIGETSLTSQLIRKIIFHDPTTQAIVKRGTNFDLIPRQKSYWYAAPRGCGLEIGNLPSQIFASWVFLDGLDKYCLHDLKVHYYVRYVDDGVALYRTPEEAERCRDRIREWLWNERGLKLSEKKTHIYPVEQGINFVGYVILPHRTYYRRMNVGRAKEAAAALRADPFNRQAFDGLNSYLGLMRHCSTFKIRKALCESVIVPYVLQCDAEYTRVFYTTPLA